MFLLNSFAGQNARGQNSERLEPTRLQLPDAIVTSQTQFDIPFNTDDVDGRLIEVQLYVSTDLGKSWQLYARQSPQARRIPFQSVGDGEYLFALKTLDRDRRLSPTGPPIPTLRIAVDTQQPELQLQIDPDKQGRLSATWRATDANLDRQSVRLFYRAAQENASPDWIPVPTGTPITESRQADPGTQEDRIVWWPDTNANAIIIKAEIKDHAGNLATVFQPVGLSAYRQTANQLPAISAGHSQLAPPDPHLTGRSATQAYKPNVGGPAAPASGPIAWPVDQHNPDSVDPSYITGNLAYQKVAPKTPQLSSTRDPFAAMVKQDPASPPTHDSLSQNQTIAQGSTLTGSSPKTTNDLPTRSRFIPQSSIASTPPKSIQPPSSPASSNPPNSNALIGSPGQPTHQVPSQMISHRPAPDSEQQPDQIPDRSPTPAEPPITKSSTSQDGSFSFAPGTYFIVNQKQFRLRYHVDGLGPEHIGSVAIFGSTDMGQTWKLWTTDQDKISPVTIDVPDQGRFAFRVVVTNLGGLASEIPAADTEPELVVDVDLTAPTPRITAAPYGKDPTRAALDIQWQCQDQDLAEQPIALAYGSSPRGPWTTITQAAPNTGQYSWFLNPNLPSMVYLRMAATDRAGNKGFFQLPHPINLAPLIPKGRILGLEK